MIRRVQSCVSAGLVFVALGAGVACTSARPDGDSESGGAPNDGVSSSVTAYDNRLPEYALVPLLDDVPSDWLVGPVTPMEVLYDSQLHRLRIVFVSTPAGTFGIAESTVDISASTVSVELSGASPTKQGGPGVTYQYIAAIPTGLGSREVRVNGQRVTVRAE